jgi:DNA-binding winged helix-turn-helix (wHTH) protein/Tol biopolymer transport system component
MRGFDAPYTLATAMPPANTPVDVSYAFGPFRLDPQQSMLFRGSEAVPLTPKVFDTLRILVENSGRVLSRDSLMEQVWGDTIVSDSNLTQNIWVLRNTLGEDESQRYIETVPRRGYRFVAPVTRLESGPEPVATVAQASPPDPQPAPPPVVDSLPAPADGYSQEFVVIRRRRSSRAVQWRWIAVSIALAVALTAVVVWWATRQQRATRGDSPLTAELLPIEDNITDIAISPDGKQIAYIARDSQDRCSLFMRGRSGTHPGVEIERAVFDIKRVAFAGDGGSLHYQLLAQPQGSQYALREYSLATGRKSVIATGIVTGAVAPRSRRVLFVPESADVQRVMLRNNAGEPERAILTLSGNSERLGRVAWSPDERLVAATHYRGGWFLAVIDPSRGSIRDIAGPWHTIRGFAWSPDGGSILTAAGSSVTDSALWKIDAATGAATRVPTSLHSVGAVSMSADASTIATVEPSASGRVVSFVSGASERQELLPSTKSGSSPRWCAGGFVAEREIGGAPDIWLLDADGKPLRQLTSTRDREAEIAVAPDGRTIAYTVFTEDGRSSIWTLSLDGGAPANVTGDVYARRPSFTHDGRAILYSELRNWWRSMIVPLDTRESRPFLPGITGFARHSPDGRHFVAARWERISDWPEYVVVRAADQQVVQTFSIQDAEQFEWMDDRTLSFVKPTGADFAIYRVSINGGAPAPVANFDSKVESYDYERVSGRFVVATTVSSTRAFLLRYVDSRS